jgi:hypothetical protein
MGFQYTETMTGTVEWDAQPGARHPFWFEVEARADSTRQHLADGKATVHGTIHASPIAQGAGVEGVVTIRPIGQRIIRYELSFAGSDGKRYQMVGQKAIRWRSPFKTFTHLPAEIFDDAHRRVGICETAFDLKRDWWSFLRSFRSLSAA